MSRYQGSQGPDISDVMLVIEEIKRLHGADVSVNLFPITAKYGCGVRVEMVVTHPTFVGPGRTYKATVVRDYPCRDHARFESLLYAMALMCDRCCARDLWRQGELESFS